MLTLMSIDPTITAERPGLPAVAAVVSAGDPGRLRRCMEAIGSQVYGVAKVLVVGGGPAGATAYREATMVEVSR